MTAAAHQPEHDATATDVPSAQVIVSITAFVGGETFTGSGSYTLGGCTLSSPEDLTERLPLLLRHIATATEAAG